jgi:hypothetical protein
VIEIRASSLAGQSHRSSVRSAIRQTVKLVGGEILAAMHQEIGEFLVDFVVEVFCQFHEHGSSLRQQLCILQKDSDLLSLLTQTF